MSIKFAYPDIPFTEDRVLYDYLFNIDRLLRSFGDNITRLSEEIQKQREGT